MTKYKVKLIMCEEYTIDAESKEEAERGARGKFGCDYYIDYVEVTEIKNHNSWIDKIKRYIMTWINKIFKK